MNKGRGFTIVELLIVVVVIAILAVITIVVYNGIQSRGSASRVATNIKNIEKALVMYKNATGASTWTVDSDPSWHGGTTGNPGISEIINYNAVFKEFLSQAPSATDLGTTSPWRYDNDNDTYNGCSASGSGVNIVAQNATNTEVALAVDKAIDDGDLACGKVRMVGTSFMYSVSNAP